QPRFSIQQQNVTTLLNLTGTKEVDSVHFTSNIWENQLGSDPLVLENPLFYQYGLIVSNNTVGDMLKVDELEKFYEAVNNSLFIRIGNSGYGSTINEELNDDISLGISAGWQIDFPIEANFDVIQVSFKWQFDAQDMAFDIYDESLPWWLNMDDSDDYQEVRCRIKHPASDQSSFWMGNSASQQNPNGTIFYRVGRNVTLDEEWFTFNYNFSVSQEVENYTLELGAYLNTREDRLEYFDVWFDDILIQGINNISDRYPPQPIDFDLSWTGTDISLWNFWAELAEGKWETPIDNITVIFYNQSKVISNRSLSLASSIMNEAGYNQTYWQYLQRFTYGENISFKLLIFDKAGNYKETVFENATIRDYQPPKITSTLNINDPSFVQQLGNGSIIIRINTQDWGNATDKVVLNYTLNGILQSPISMIRNGTNYQAKIPVIFGTRLEFDILLNDTNENSRKYPGYSVVSDKDIIPPKISFDVNASRIEEGRTFVNVTAEDSFGEIDRVFLVIRYENGSLYDNKTLVYDNTTEKYKFSEVKGLLLKYAENYNMTVFARDKGGSLNSSTMIYTVPDIIAPIVNIEDIEYTQPGLLKIWVYADDPGSSIDSVTLETRRKGEWIVFKNMTIKNNLFYADINTDWFGNEEIEFRINAIDNEGNEIIEEDRPIRKYITRYFFATSLGLLITEAIVVIAAVSLFTTIKIAQSQRLRAVRRRRFEVALGRSERLAYLGEEAMFGFVAAYGQREGVSSILLWEPRLIGHFYQYLKELTDKANNNIAFIMQTKPQDQVTFIDFTIEEIGCSAITFAYPVSTLPQQWLSALTLDQVPVGGGQGVLLLMLVMREKWSETANNFQEEIKDGIVELKDLIISGEDKNSILKKAREFRLFISGTLEVLDEIEMETDEVSEDIMGDFEAEFLDDEETDET
ncbi:MAG: hypothetical protein JSU57_00315, partial [Candidatus Heimdallarchaeota archaeon]